MKRTTKAILAGASIGVVVVGGAGMALATERSEPPARYVSPADTDDGERPIDGSALERASRAALTYLGEGRVTETEVGDEESYYEVEVTLDDGSQVDVQLDESFTVVGTEADGPGDKDD